MNRLLSIVAVVLSVTTVPAVHAQQGLCGTVPTAKAIGYLPPTLLQHNPAASYTVALHVHYIAPETAPAPTISAMLKSMYENLYEGLGIVGKDFSSIGVCFVVTGMDTIYSNYFDSRSLLTAGDSVIERDYDSLVSVRSHTDAIDVYIHNSQNGGKTNGIPGTAFVIGSYYLVTHLFSHELGHCLGLYHTHHGTYNEEYENVGDSNACKENVTRITTDPHYNAATCGDYVEDTPADPRFTLSRYSACLSGCTWSNDGTTCNATDDYGELYQPISTNIMSYGQNNDCLNELTSGQGIRMFYFLATDPRLRQRLIPTTSDIYIQNETISAPRTELTPKAIILGDSVTTGTRGNVIVTTAADVRLRAGRFISLQTGCSVSVGTGRVFDARIVAAACEISGTRRRDDHPNTTSNGISSRRDTRELLPSTAILNVSPNVSPERLTIIYTIPTPANTRISIRDAIGREEAVVSDEWQNAGRYALLWNPGKLSNGTYYVILETGGKTVMQKVVITR